MSLLLGYNTNGFAHHGLESALEIIAETGYRSVGLTRDVNHRIDGDALPEFRDRLAKLGLVPVMETGARFLWDSRRKHHPTLLSRGEDDHERRIDALRLEIEDASELGAPCVSFWSGRDEGGDNWSLVEHQLTVLCLWADMRGVDLAFEPEPGMFIDTMAKFDELCRRVVHPRLKLTLDVGHIHCLEEEPPADVIRRYSDKLANVHLDDHRKGVHDHLMFGEGEIDFGPVMEALKEVAQDRDLPATVELSRHSHDAVETARKSFEFLSGLL